MFSRFVGPASSFAHNRRLHSRPFQSKKASLNNRKMPPVIVHCGFFRREVSPEAAKTGEQNEPSTAGNGDGSSSHFSSNRSVNSLEAAIATTRNRIDYLWSFVNSSSPSRFVDLVNQKTLFLVWQLNVAFNDFLSQPQWLELLAQEISNVNFQKLAVDVFLSHLQPEAVEDDDSYRLAENLFGILVNCSEISKLFCQSLARAEAIEELIDVITRFKATRFDPSRIKQRGEQIVGYCFAVIFNIAKKAPSLAKLHFSDYDAEIVIRSFLASKNCCYVRVVAALCLALTADESSDENQFPKCDNSDVVQLMLDFFTLASLGENRRYRGVSTVEIGNGLRNVASFGSGLLRKPMIDGGVLSICGLLLNSTLDVEQSLGVDLLSALSTSQDNCANIVNNDGDCMNPLQMLATNNSQDVELRQKAAKLIDFLIEMKEKLSSQVVSPVSYHQPKSTSSNEAYDVQAFANKKKPSVYLSFNKTDLPTVRKIERLLLDNSFTVANQTSADPRNTAEETMPNANVVAICHSEAYNLSSACRREAQFAKTLHKKIVSVRVDAEYEPEGWLEQLLEYSALVHVEADEALLQMNSDSGRKLLLQLANLLVE